MLLIEDNFQPPLQTLSWPKVSMCFGGDLRVIATSKGTFGRHFEWPTFSAIFSRMQSVRNLQFILALLTSIFL